MFSVIVFMVLLLFFYCSIDGMIDRLPFDCVCECCSFLFCSSPLLFCWLFSFGQCFIFIYWFLVVFFPSLLFWFLKFVFLSIIISSIYYWLYFVGLMHRWWVILGSIFVVMIFMGNDNDEWNHEAYLLMYKNSFPLRGILNTTHILGLEEGKRVTWIWTNLFKILTAKQEKNETKNRKKKCICMTQLKIRTFTTILITILANDGSRFSSYWSSSSKSPKMHF